MSSLWRDMELSFDSAEPKDFAEFFLNHEESFPYGRKKAAILRLCRLILRGKSFRGYDYLDEIRDLTDENDLTEIVYEIIRTETGDGDPDPDVLEQYAEDLVIDAMAYC